MEVRDCLVLLCKRPGLDSVYPISDVAKVRLGMLGESLIPVVWDGYDSMQHGSLFKINVLRWLASIFL